MFEIGFSELVLVGLVALLVIGPERLPKVARLAGFWLGKARTMMASVKAEIRQELHAEEIRQVLQDQSGLKEFEQVLNETSNSIKSSLEKPPEDSLAKVTPPNEPK
jgi:sec-independent protein translocase protein TatB